MNWLALPPFNSFQYNRQLTRVFPSDNSAVIEQSWSGLSKQQFHGLLIECQEGLNASVLSQQPSGCIPFDYIR